MRIVIVSRGQTDYARAVEEYMRDYTRQTGHELEYLDADSSEGSTFSETYDIVEYPTLLALSDEGRVVSSWRGLPLPTMSEVSYYAD